MLLLSFQACCGVLVQCWSPGCRMIGLDIGPYQDFQRKGMPRYRHWSWWLLLPQLLLANLPNSYESCSSNDWLTHTRNILVHVHWLRFVWPTCMAMFTTHMLLIPFTNPHGPPLKHRPNLESTELLPAFHHDDTGSWIPIEVRFWVICTTHPQIECRLVLVPFVESYHWRNDRT